MPSSLYTLHDWHNNKGLTFDRPIMHLSKPVLHTHNDVIKWKLFPRYWPFARGIHRSPMNFPHKCQWRDKPLSKPMLNRFIDTYIFNQDKIFSFRKMYLKLATPKRQPFFPEGDEDLSSELEQSLLNLVLLEYTMCDSTKFQMIDSDEHREFDIYWCYTDSCLEHHCTMTPYDVIDLGIDLSRKYRPHNRLNQYNLSLSKSLGNISMWHFRQK